MKELLSDSSSSSSSSGTAKSGTTTTNVSSTPSREDRAEARDSYYFPGCRKDANCDCEICLASISATLDLMPASVQKSSFTKLSPSSLSTAPRRTPVSFDPSILSTPGSSISKTVDSRPSLLSAALRERKDMGKKKAKLGSGSESGSRQKRRFMWWALCLVLIFMADLGFRWLVSAAIRPELSSDVVRQIGVESQRVSDLMWKIRFMQGEIRSLVEGRVWNCSDQKSAWKISQGGLLLNSRCTLYKSMTEEVSIWGWPLQTAGLLTTGASSRSFTIIKGRVTEWSNGNMGYTIRKVTSSWMQRKWSASVVQLDPGTLILEYKRSPTMDDSGFLMTAVEFLKYHMTVVIGRLNQKFWYFPAFKNDPGQIRAKYISKVPT